MNSEDREKKEYEIAVLLKNEADLANVLTLIKQHNGEMSSEMKTRNVALAYEIKKHKEAVFAYANFRGYPEDAKELENDLNLRTDVVRFLIIASPPAAEKIVPNAGVMHRRGRPIRSGAAPTGETPFMPKPQAPRPLSNEALEKKIEEILQ
jgi:ribosomal protein S6